MIRIIQKDKKDEIQIAGEKKVIVDRNPLTMAAADKTPAGSK